MSQKNSNPPPTGARPAPPPNPPKAGPPSCERELVEFFRGEGYLDFGLNGDNMCWSPARTAIEAMLELMKLRATAAREKKAAAVSPGALRILDERHRQVNKLGWDAEHDDQHDDRSLATVAALYATPDIVYVREDFDGGAQFIDPWPSSWAGDFDNRPMCGGAVLPNSTLPRPKRIRQLEKAGALIAAEIDRLLREEAA